MRYGITMYPVMAYTRKQQNANPIRIHTAEIRFILLLCDELSISTTSTGTMAVLVKITSAHVALDNVIQSLNHFSLLFAIMRITSTITKAQITPPIIAASPPLDYP
jgi:hypothetical protein